MNELWENLKNEREPPVKKLFNEWMQIDPKNRPPFWEWMKGRKKDE